MKIVVDMQGAQASNKNRGIGRYSLSLVEAIARNSTHHQITIILNQLFPESADYISDLFSAFYPSVVIKRWSPIRGISYLKNDASSPRIKVAESITSLFISSLDPDVVLYTSMFEGLIDDVSVSISPGLADRLDVCILYDLIPLINSDRYLSSPVIKSWYFAKLSSLKRSDLLLAISDSSKSEAISHISRTDGDCISIYADADPKFIKLDLSEDQIKQIKQKYSIDDGFILYTGGIDHRKNIEGLIAAYAALEGSLRSKYQLVIVCSIEDESIKILKALAENLRLSEQDLLLTGFIPDQDLVKLYNTCDLFVFPSWHEGFGLPVLEAMRCGAPVICSSVSSLPEICDFSDAMFDPHDIEQISKLLKKSLVSTEFRNQLVENSIKQQSRYDWDSSAKLALSTIENAYQQKLLSSGSIPSVPRKTLRLAYLSPLPPEKSGISWYSQDLLPELCKYYDVDIIVSQEVNEIKQEWGHLRAHSIEWFKLNHGSYDRILYHFGNSHFHSYMVDLIDEIPGVIVLHDFFLSGLYWHIESSGVREAFFSFELYHSHGYKALYEKEAEGKIMDCISSYPCNRAVICNSIGVIVHSNFSRRLYESYYQASAESWSVIPLVKSLDNRPCPKESRKILGFDTDAFIVCSFGIIAPSKLSDRLLDSWLNSDLSDKDNSYLVFVGANVWGEYARNLEMAIECSGYADKILVTGWISSDDFARYLEVADVAVQLRSMTRGETSAAVYDCMKHESPLIVNANGSMAELPNEAVFMLPDSFSNQQLSDALDYLYYQPSHRMTLAKQAYKHVSSTNSPLHCAKLFNKAIESYYAKHQSTSIVEEAVISCGIDVVSESSFTVAEISTALSHSLMDSRDVSHQFMIDITSIHDLSCTTSYSNFMRRLIRSLLLNQPYGWRVEPVLFLQSGQYLYARKDTMSLLDINFQASLEDEPINFYYGDIFWPDKHIAAEIQGEYLWRHKSLINDMRRIGVSVISELNALALLAGYVPPPPEPLDITTIDESVIDYCAHKWSEWITEILTSLASDLKTKR